MKLKHRLPAYSILDHLCLDNALLEELTACVHELNDEFKTLLEVNKGFCGLNHEFTKSAYDNFSVFSCYHELSSLRVDYQK